MGIADLLFHVLGFAAPALALSLGMAAACFILWRGAPAKPSFMARTGMLFIVALAVLLGGLWLSGHDGRMGTYAVLVLACASCQWWWLRGR